MIKAKFNEWFHSNGQIWRKDEDKIILYRNWKGNRYTYVWRMPNAGVQMIVK